MITEEKLLETYQRYVEGKLQEGEAGAEQIEIIGYGPWKAQILGEIERPNPWDNGK